jgi:hypothetical protein
MNLLDFVLGLGVVIGALLATFMLFTLYLSYCTLHVAMNNGKLAAAPKIVQVACWGTFIIALVLDVLFNITVGSLVFVELPELRRLTFTMRCKKWMPYGGHPFNPPLVRWRGKIARWVCDGWLNPFEAGHC